MSVGKIFPASVGVLCISVSSFLFAAPNDVVSPVPLPAKMQEINQQIQSNLEQQFALRVHQQRVKVPEEAVASVVKTREALRLLESNKIDAARSQLDKALQKIDRLISHDPSVKAVPIQVSQTSKDRLNNFDAIRRAKLEIEHEWQHGYWHRAKQLLKNFASVTSVETQEIPVARYRAALIEAKAQLDNAQQAKAKSALQDVLALVWHARYQVPLPLYRAELMLASAEKLSAATPTVDHQQLLALLDNVRYQLQMAEALGYGDQQRYALFQQGIQGIKTMIAAQQPTSAMLRKLKTAVFNLKQQMIDQH